MLADVAIYTKKPKRSDKEQALKQATIAGLKALGLTVRTSNSIAPSHMAIMFFGPKDGPREEYRRDIIDTYKSTCRPWICIENGFTRSYLVRNQYFSIGWKGIAGRAHYLAENSPKDRWEHLNIQLQPWQKRKTGIPLLCTQVPGDSNLAGLDYIQWLTNTCKELKLRTDFRIRLHPKLSIKKKTNILYYIKKYQIDKRPLRKAIQDASTIIAYNSNILVDAAITGTPIITLGDNSITKEISSNSLNALENPIFPDRQQWAHNLAYKQWNLKEIAQGFPFKHLKVPEVITGLKICALPEKGIFH
jgi:hypothetical protein